MNDEPSLNRKTQISPGESSAGSSELVARDCTMSRENLQRRRCFLCGQSMRSIFSIPIMGGGE